MMCKISRINKILVIVDHALLLLIIIILMLLLKEAIVMIFPVLICEFEMYCVQFV